MPVRAVVAGAGSMGMNHLRVLKEFSEDVVELVAVAEPDEAARARVESRFGVTCYADYHEMIAATKPDLATVVVPTNLHFDVAAHILDAEVNVLVEKPIAATVEQARQLVDLADQRGVKLAVGHVERFNPAVVELKRLLDEGGLGAIFSLLARRLGPFPPRIRDVGVILDLATHDLDVMRYLTGSDVVHVSAETQRRVHDAHEDMVLALVRFANDAVGVLDVNWLTPTKVRELSVTGERGMYLVNYLTQDLYFYENSSVTRATWDGATTPIGVSEGAMTRLVVRKAEPLKLEYEDIFRALRTGSDVTVTGRDGLAVLEAAHQLVAVANADQHSPASGGPR